MAVTIGWYHKAIKNMALGLVNWTGGVIKCSLHTSGYTPVANSHEWATDLSNELNVTGYTAATLTNCQIVVAAGEINFKANNVVWQGALIEGARVAVIWQDKGTPNTSPLLCYVNFGVDREAFGGAFEIHWYEGTLGKILIG